MANHSDNNNSADLAGVPALHSFEFDKTAIGNIKSSVNKFRGVVSLPLDFLTLPGQEGLDVKLSVLYSSNIKNNLNTWNLDSPTGILGLGWQMPIEMIIAEKNGSASSSNDTYYLFSGGSANPMVKTGETVNGEWLFQLRNYQFWSVIYNPVLKTWTIVKENGFVYTYGAGHDLTSNATQWGVSWGNWIGSSNVGASQVQFPLAWNLASIVTPMGNSVQYKYKNVNQKLINSALEYTQASYLEKVIDSYGRIITFNYGNKFGALNPDTNASRTPIVEYQARHTQIAPPSPNAYQDRFETLYLDAVDVVDADGHYLSGIKFTYTFTNNAPTADGNYSLMYKRCLQSVFQYFEKGETLPAMNFEYAPAGVGSTSINPGALSAITYPEGGKASFEYKIQTINSVNSSKKVQINNPVSGSIPRVWFGTNYVVFSYLSNNQIKIIVQSWNGQWVPQNLPVISKSAESSSINVLTSENFFALSFRNSTTGNDELYLYRNDDRGQDLRFGKWVLSNSQPFILNVKAGSKSSSIFVAGDSFVMAYNKDYTTTRVQGFSYAWQDDRWNGGIAPPVPPSSDCEFANINALQNFYVVGCYLQNSKTLKNYIFYRLADGTWKAGGIWSSSNTDILVDQTSGQPYLILNPTSTSVALTYATKSNSTAIDYTIKLFNWDEHFFVLNSNSPATVSLSSPIVGNESLYKIFQTIIVGSTLNNNLALMRNAGGDQRFGSVWNQKQFISPGATTKINNAIGEDVSMLSPTTTNPQNQLATFNPNSDLWSVTNGPAGSSPSISENYMTVGNNIYYRKTDGTWRSLTTTLSNNNFPESLQNRGPKFIAYQDASTGNVSTFVLPLKNGNAQTLQKLGGVKIYVPGNLPGTFLVAGRFLVTYPSSATSFDTSPSMDLWNLDEVNFNQVVNDNPVAYMQIENKIDPTQNYYQSFFYANSAESQIVYNALNGVAQYPLVTVVPGIMSKLETPPSTPVGRSQFYFSNGLAQQSTLYPSGGVQNYQNILNGIQLGQKDFDKDGNLVSSQLDYWTVYSKDQSGQNLFGGYAKCERSVSQKDGLEQVSKAAYDHSTGMVLWQDKSYFDAQGTPKNIRSETLYAYQVPEYNTVFNKLHLFTSVAMTSQSVMPLAGGSRNYTKSQATTYRNWSDTSKVSIDCHNVANCRFAAYEIFDWTTPGSTTPLFPASPSLMDNWQLKTRVLSRSNTKFLITEQIDGSGLISSFIYDKGQEFLVAKFPNASISGEEASYYGFEDYETAQNWQLGSGASIIPNAQNPAIDAHTGRNSLSISAGAKGILNSFKPSLQDQNYVFSAWVKKPSGFDNAAGNASWKISAGGSTLYTLNFPNIIGEWVYIYQIIDIPTNLGTGTLLIECENLNTGSNVLVDNLRFSPVSSLAEAYSYVYKLEQPNVILGPNGETTRKIYNHFQQEVLSTNAADRTSQIQNSYFSRSGNQGSFSPADPNHSLKITAANGGKITEFTHGSEWEVAWQPEANVWSVEGTILHQKSGNLPSWLACGDARVTANYALDLEFNVLETLMSPLGIQLGTAFTIQWNPQLTSWQFLNSSNIDVLPPVDARAFSLPSSPYDAQLDGGIISNALCLAFEAAGFLLSPKSTISAGAANAKGWTLTSPDNSFRYALKVEGSQILVYTMNTQWNLLVGEKAVVFWADGKLIFSYASSKTLSVLPKLFFGNRVAISQIATALNPLADISFDDSRGMNIQVQQYAETKMIATQAVSDNMGRMAVRTKAAYVDSGQNAMFAYFSGFAIMDWTTGTMTGLINTAYPADKGYPFARQTFETSPSGRVTHESIPGDLFRVDGGQCTSFIYGAEIGKNGDFIYAKKTTTNPNGDVFYEISTLLEQVIINTSAAPGAIRNETFFDDTGNATIIHAPNYFNPPLNSTQNDWETIQKFDYSNRLLSLNQGAKTLSKFIYDQAGNVRFSQDAQGEKDGTFNYIKYDILSRPIETGYYTGNWDPQILQNYAQTAPSWPVNSLTWREKNTYDVDGSLPNAIGRITKMEANNGTTGIADVHENIRYDLLGNTIYDALKVEAFDGGQDKMVTYEYNDLGNITKIQYPVNQNNYSIYYHINAMNQIAKITDKMETKSFTPISESTIGIFTYDAAGNPLENQIVLYNNGFVKQTYGFNSPSWLTKINSQNQGGKKLFEEDLTYTDGGFNGAKYYDGTIASSSVEVEGITGAPDQYQYAYDQIGQITDANNQADPSHNLGVQPPVSYDANGNILGLGLGNTPYTYNYNQGSQELSDIKETATSKLIAQFGYDQNGNVKHLTTYASNITKPYALTFQYDPASMMPVSVNDANPGGVSLNFIYGARKERLLKDVTGTTPLAGKKLYIRGTNALPLQEIFKSANGLSTSAVNYIYGPGGLIAMRKMDVNFTFYHVLKDHLGSIRGVMDLNGGMVASYQYLANGTLSKVVEPSPGFMPYLYTGQEYDAEIGLYNYRARFYFSEIGRFIAIDPARQYFSPYIYASNNPILFIDPTGMTSLKSIFSAIGGIIIGAIEILIGVVIDVIAAAVEALAIVFTGGLGTPAAIALGALSGVFYGAGISAITYPVFNFDDFSWKDYGIQMGIGALTGAFSGGLGAGIGIAAKSVQVGLTEFSQGVRATAGELVQAGRTVAGTAYKAGAFITEKGAALAGLATNGPVTAGWQGVAKGIGIGVIKSEAIGITINTGKNLALGNNWDAGLNQVIFSSALSGTIGGFQVKNRIIYGTQ